MNKGGGARVVAASALLLANDDADPLVIFYLENARFNSRVKYHSLTQLCRTNDRVSVRNVNTLRLNRRLFARSTRSVNPLPAVSSRSAPMT